MNFSQTLSANLSDLPEETPLETWLHDETRIGQKNSFVRQWSRREERPRQPGRSALRECLSPWRHMSGTWNRRSDCHATCRH